MAATLSSSRESKVNRRWARGCKGPTIKDDKKGGASAVKKAQLWKLVAGSVNAWAGGSALEWGAALAYYTAFSIAPLLIIALGIVGLFYKGDGASYIHSQIAGLVGENAASAITSAIH